MQFETPEMHDALEGVAPPQIAHNIRGHATELEFLRETISGRKFHHALIFEGERGIGKATVAFRLANALLSGHDLDDPFAPPDFASGSFRQIAQGVHPGFLYLSRPRKDQGTGFKSAITIDEIRRLHRFFGMTAAASDSYRVVIIDPVNDLNRNAANALLKMLEEPPAKALFVLIAHGTGGLLPTIRSRCQILKFAPLDDDAVMEIAGEQTSGLDADKLAVIAKLSGGSARRALVFAQFGGIDLMEALDAYLRSARPDTARAHKLAEVAATRGSDMHRDILRELVMDRLRAAATAAAQRGDLRSAERLATASMAMQEHMRISDAFNLDRKQDFLILLADIHDLLSPVSAA
jgi:DNA polymerase-3 subunit delta'